MLVFSANLFRLFSFLPQYLSGPKLPVIRIGNPSLITSPTGKGVILIGGRDIYDYSGKTNLIELSGNSIESLAWTILEQTTHLERSNSTLCYIENEFMNIE